MQKFSKNRQRSVTERKSDSQMKTMRCLVTDNSGYLWLRQWLFYSLKVQLSNQSVWNEQLRRLSEEQPSQSFIIGISGAQGSGKVHSQPVYNNYGLSKGCALM